MSTADDSNAAGGGFQHQALPIDDPQILRILRVLPGSKAEPVICTLDLARFLPRDDKPPEESSSDPPVTKYQALSYCWGDESEQRTITLNDHEYRVRQNLYTALQHLRTETEERVLWVDAICIDQENTTEKEREVRRMSSIYHSADRVIIWLGEASDDSDKALDFADKIYKCFPVFGFIEDPEFEDDFNWADDDMRFELVKEYLDEKYVDSWKALYNIFSRPWWERAWTLQELIVSHRATVQCGETTKPWVVIGTAANITNLTLGIIHDLMFKVPGSYYAWPRRYAELITQASQARIHRFQKDDRYAVGFASKPMTMDRADGASKSLTTNMTRSCSLPHDKIYSVIGVLPKALQEAIQPNYKEPARMAFKKAAKACVEVTGWLNIICHSQYSAWYPAGHPSWLPDWTKASRSTVFVERNSSVMPWHFPVGSTPAKASFSEDLSTLTAEGFIISGVKEMALELKLLPGVDRFFAYHYLSPDQIADLRNTMDTGDPEFQYLDSKELFWRSDPNVMDFEKQFLRVILPVFLRFTRTVLEDPLDLFINALTELYEQSKTSDDLPDPAEVDKGRSYELQDLYRKTRGHLMSRTIFATYDGRLGIGPDFMRSEYDIVCLLLGCDAPVILRRRKDGSYMFVGEAHVPTLNEGEGMQGLKDGKFSLKTFNIK